MKFGMKFTTKQKKLLEDHHEVIPSSLSLPSYTRLSEPPTADLGETAHEKTVSDSI